MGKMDEQITVVPRVEIFGKNNERHFQGVFHIEDDVQKASEIMDAIQLHSSHARRGDVENDPSLQQPIPYGVLVSEHRDGEIRVFAYERLSSGGEKRLHGSISIGVGGHMNKLFSKSERFFNTVMQEAERELTEELTFESVEGEVNIKTYKRDIIGFINDDENDVGKVHFGILYLVHVNPNHIVSVRETDQLKGEWMTLDELEAAKDRLESWSLFALEALKKYYDEA